MVLLANKRKKKNKVITKIFVIKQWSGRGSLSSEFMSLTFRSTCPILDLTGDVTGVKIDEGQPSCDRSVFLRKISFKFS